MPPAMLTDSCLQLQQAQEMLAAEQEHEQHDQRDQELAHEHDCGGASARRRRSRLKNSGMLPSGSMIRNSRTPADNVLMVRFHLNAVS